VTESNCDESDHQNPTSNLTNPREDDFTIIENYSESELENIEIIQLRPQEVRARLRQSRFFRNAKDLYYT